MNAPRNATAACVAIAGLLAWQPAPTAAAPQMPSSGAAAARGQAGPGPAASPSTYRGNHGSHRYGGYSGYRTQGYAQGGWSLGVAVGVPWALGWYDPWWGSVYYPPYGYAWGSAHPAYGDGCGWDEDCQRARLSQGEPAPPTTRVPPPAPGEAGVPTVRPLHLNYCESARAWFPQVRTCAEGWRFVRPEYPTPR